MNLKFLLDESCPKRIAYWLKTKGHEAITLEDLRARGIANGGVAEHAIEQDAIILTCDSDFLILRRSLLPRIRTILIQVHPRTKEKVQRVLEENLSKCINILRHPGKIILTEEGLIHKKSLE